MAKIVLAGRSDCPHFARCELLGDRLAKNLKKFNLHKIVIQPDQWEMWLSQTCDERGWSVKKSPIVWRELVDRGGKGVLIGDASDFQEYAKAYYDVESQMNSFDMQTVSYENKITKDICDEEERAFKALSQPVRICITNAASPACYYLLNSLCSGQVLGPGVELTISLLVSSVSDVEQVKGTAMEAEDLACCLLRDVKVHTSPHEAFEDCSIIILLDTLPRLHNESTKEWIDKNQEFFSIYATIISHKALKSCKILLCGSGPTNFNAMVIAGDSPNISNRNIIVVSSVVEKVAKSLIGEKLEVNQAGVVNLIVWGNVNGKHHFDVSKCKVHGYSGAVTGPSWYSVGAEEMIHDQKWLKKELPKHATSRYRKMSESHGYLSGIGTANAIANTLQHLCRGSPEKQIFSLGVQSEGWYSVPRGIFFSFPVTMDTMGCWHIVEDIDISKDTKIAIDECVQDINYQLLLFVGPAGPVTDKYNFISRGMKLTHSMLELSANWDIFGNLLDKASLWSLTTASRVVAELTGGSKKDTLIGSLLEDTEELGKSQLDSPNARQDIGEESDKFTLQSDITEPLDDSKTEDGNSEL